MGHLGCLAATICYRVMSPDLERPGLIQTMAEPVQSRFGVRRLTTMPLGGPTG
jgi:hypothetical protein